MLSRLSVLSSLALSSILAVGCAVSADESESTAGSESELTSIAPASVRLFKEPNHVPNPECESFTDLRLESNGQAHLVNGLGGRCALTALIDPNPRAYSLRLTGTPCGSKVYEGSRRVALGPATTGIATIKITDNRMMTCDVAAPAEIVVEETTGTTITTMYSASTRPSNDRPIIVCDEPLIDHGAGIRFFADNEGAIARAEYTETTIADTFVVANMNVCFAHPVPQGADMINKTVSCNDVSWVNSYSVELYEGGKTGIPSMKLFKSNAAGQKEQLHAFNCQYVRAGQ